jgi:hypothetical protein
MNLSADILSRLDELVFHQNVGSQRVDDALSGIISFLRQLSTGFDVGMVLCVCAVVALVLVYRPRLARGSFWVPIFGLFGGKPTLYLHTRPSSFCGFFKHSRRLRTGRKSSSDRSPRKPGKGPVSIRSKPFGECEEPVAKVLVRCPSNDRRFVARVGSVWRRVGRQGRLE